MVAWLPKQFEQCPKCEASEVDVPWSPLRTRRRRVVALLIRAVWVALAPWLAVAVLLNSWVFGLAGLLGTVLITFWFVLVSRRGLAAFRCLACGHRWRR